MIITMGRPLFTGPAGHAIGKGSGYEGCETVLLGAFKAACHTYTYIKDKFDSPNHHT
jgi:hypothetical protein